MEIFNGDQEMVDFFQRWCGYCLTGDVSEHQFLFAYGIGANGKSTAIKAVASVLGEYAHSSSSSLFCASPRGKDRERASPDVAALAGVRFAYASEPGEGEHFDEDKLKMLTGGEVLSARFLNQNPFTYTPTAKLVISGNHRPVIRGTDEGIWRRPLLMPFLRHFAEHERDHALDEVLSSEASGILAWAVRGCLEWRRQRLAPPASIRAAIKEYRRGEDVIGQFLAEHIEESQGDAAARSAVYDKYKAWLESENVERIPSRQKFNRKMIDRGFREGKDGDGIAVWKNTALKR